MPFKAYDGTSEYAKTKRQQVTLAEFFAEQYPEVTFVSMHPGWYDTPGVETSLPDFHKKFGKSLRTPAMGADTITWLAVEKEEYLESGQFYRDRSPETKHLWGGGTKYDDATRNALVETLQTIVAHGGRMPPPG